MCVRTYLNKKCTTGWKIINIPFLVKVDAQKVLQQAMSTFKLNKIVKTQVDMNMCVCEVCVYVCMYVHINYKTY